MIDKPLILSILIGLIIILLIAGISMLVKMNTLDESYKKELAKNITLQKTVEELKSINANLKEENANLKEKNAKTIADIEELKIELIKLEKLKNKLEENLKEELMKSKNESTVGN